MHCGTCEEKGISLSTMVNIADAVLAEGLASAAEVKETIAELTVLTEDERSIVGCPRISSCGGGRSDSHGPTMTICASDGTPLGPSRKSRYGPAGARLAPAGASARRVVADVAEKVRR